MPARARARSAGLSAAGWGVVADAAVGGAMGDGTGVGAVAATAEPVDDFDAGWGASFALLQATEQQTVTAKARARMRRE